ncbi:MAG: hypothetical protein R2813_03190 [Flavobacteriales bacterium]
MKRGLAFLFGFFLYLTGIAQDTIWVDLSGLQLNTQYSYSLDTVVCAAQNQILGSYEGQIIASTQPIDAALKRAHHSDVGTATSYSLLIHNINLTADAAKDNYIRATTVFSFHRPVGNGEFEYLNVSKTCPEKFLGKEGAQSLMSALNCAIGECFDSLNHGIMSDHLIRGSEIKIPPIEVITSHYLDQPFFEGYFPSYGAFVEGKLTRCKDYELRSRIMKNQDAKAYKLFDPHGIRTRDFWGYSDGNRIYVNINDFFYPLDISRNQISTTYTAYNEWKKDDIRYERGQFVLNATTLAMGAGHIYLAGPVYQGEDYHISLDHLNGSFIETDRWVQRYTPTEMYFYTAKSLKQDSVVIDIDGEPVCLLGANEYFYFNSIANNSSTSFCITSPTAEQTCTDVVAFEGGLRCYYIKLKRTGVPVIDPMSPEQYSPIMELIDAGKVKPGCGYSPNQ